MNSKISKVVFSGIAIFLLCLNSFSSNNEKVTVRVEFNGASHNIEKQVIFEDGLSALEALMYVAKIQTHPVNDKYVFVDVINDIESVKGKNAWYFMVNGKPSQTLAINCNLAAGDTITWIYKQDVCSKTIESKEPCSEDFGL